jgi:hypothetical protein
MPLIPHDGCFERSFSPGAEIRPEGWNGGERVGMDSGRRDGTHGVDQQPVHTTTGRGGWDRTRQAGSDAPAPLESGSSRSSYLHRSRDPAGAPSARLCSHLPQKPLGEVELQARRVGWAIGRASDRGAQDNEERGAGHDLTASPRRSGQRSRVLQSDGVAGCRGGRVPGALRLLQRPLRGAPHPSPLPQTARERETILHLAKQAAGPGGARPGRCHRDECP